MIIELLGRYQGLSALIQSDDLLKKRFDEIQSFANNNDVDFLIEEIPDALEQSLSGVETIAAIVRSISALVHPSSRQKVATNVNECIKNAVTISKGKWKNSLELEMDLADDLPKVMCLRRRTWTGCS